MSFLFHLILSRTTVYVTVMMHAVDAVGFIAAVLSGEATTDFLAILAAIDFSS